MRFALRLSIAVASFGVVCRVTRSHASVAASCAFLERALKGTIRLRRKNGRSGSWPPGKTCEKVRVAPRSCVWLHTSHSAAVPRKNRQTATYPRCELPILVGGDQTHIRVITEQHSRFPSQSWLGNRQRESKSDLKRVTSPVSKRFCSRVVARRGLWLLRCASRLRYSPLWATRGAYDRVTLSPTTPSHLLLLEGN